MHSLFFFWGVNRELSDKSILTDVKKLLSGIPEDSEAFDEELIIFINGVFSILLQLGVSFKKSFWISDKDDTWELIFGENEKINFIQTYVYLKTKLVFDPPSSSTVIQSYENQIKELEWRINAEVDTKQEEIQNE